MALQPDEYANLKGKQHPLYRGVLREAHANGLLELSVKLIEAPTAENGQTAICEATAVFPGDGRERIFTEIGDCNERNCTPMIAAHRIRMAATRAKGRALRDALGIGEALVEEMGPDNDETSHRGAQAPAQGQQRPSYTSRQQPRERSAPAPVGDTAGDRRAASGALAEGSAPPAVAPVAHFCSTCGVEVQGVTTAKGPVSAETVVSLSQSRWGETLCHQHGRERMEMEKANLPAGQIAA